MCRLEKSVTARVRFSHFRLSTGSSIASVGSCLFDKPKKGTHFRLGLLSISDRIFGLGHFLTALLLTNLSPLFLTIHSSGFPTTFRWFSPSLFLGNLNI